MQQAETVLNVIRERGERGLPLENIYRLLYNRNLYLRAYGRIYSNQGATTEGVTAETMDGMSLAKIDRIIEALRYERFRWTPVRRVNIPKPNGTTRALGIPTGPDKLLQEVIRMILEAYYEPQFSDRSHGFRPGRGCHTALGNVVDYWTGVRWFVEGDIKGCFDNIDHDVLLSVLGEKLHDNRFLRLLRYLQKAGYVEDWKYGRTLSGTPQGGIVSPILANIYLDRLDKFVENVMIPAHTRGSDRRDNREYTRLLNQAAGQRKRGNHAEALQLRKQMQQLLSRDPYDPGYRRLRYVRYADDFVLGFIGPKVEAQQVKESLETFLHDTLKLELSREKTLITPATSQAAEAEPEPEPVVVEVHVNGSDSNGHVVEPVVVSTNGNGHQEEPAEGQQSLFSWAEFLAEEPAQPQGRNGKAKPSSLSLFEWALGNERELEKEPVGAGR